MKVAGEVEVDFLHRHDLTVSPAGGAALDSEDRPEAGLAQAEHGIPSTQRERIGESDGGRGLPLSGRRRADARDQHEAPIARSFGASGLEWDLRLVVPERDDVFWSQADLGSDFLDGSKCGFLCNLDIGLHGISFGFGRQHRVESR